MTLFKTCVRTGLQYASIFRPALSVKMGRLYMKAQEDQQDHDGNDRAQPVGLPPNPEPATAPSGLEDPSQPLPFPFH